MAILLSVNKVHKAFGAKALFDEVTFVIEEDERIGLIGPNGSGKSTLLKILAGEMPADTGELSSRRGLRIGYLEQTPHFEEDKSVQDSIRLHLKDPTNLALLGEVMSKLELAAVAEHSVSTLSGGWKKRVALARELVKEPDLLLLDEPTNHLDVESILWLENFLAKSRLAVLTVTHDRLFLQRVANRILELDRRNPQGLLSVRGDYAAYLERKESLIREQQQREDSLQNKLRREVEWLRRGAKARTTKQQARIQAAAALQDEVETLSERNRSRTARLEFQSFEKQPKRLIEAKQISKSLGGRCLFEHLDLFIGPKSRIGLLGANGSGKSTLIRVLLGDIPQDSGHVFRTDHLRPAYFDQNRERLDPSQTLRKAICPYGDQVNYRGTLVHVNGYLERFLFRREQFDMPVGRLSGGEQSRILIAQLMLQEANLLVLDEPTNDLDVETLDILEECLEDFEGAVLLVTHDRYFLDQVADEILAFPASDASDRRLISYSGLAQWEARQREKSDTKRTDSPPDPARSEATKKRKLSFHEVRELEGMEKKIQSAEASLKALEEESQLPKNASNAQLLSDLCQQIAQKQLEIEQLYARWAELEALQQSLK